MSYNPVESLYRLDFSRKALLVRCIFLSRHFSNLPGVLQATLLLSPKWATSNTPFTS
jgi:hypothetical protein